MPRRLAEEVCKELLDDEIFVNTCKGYLYDILEDGKLTTGDLPRVFDIVCYVYSEQKTLRLIEETDIVEVLRLLIVELLRKLELAENAQMEEEGFKRMIETCLNLIVKRVKTTRSCWEGSSCFC